MQNNYLVKNGGKMKIGEEVCCKKEKITTPLDPELCQTLYFCFLHVFHKQKSLVHLIISFLSINIINLYFYITIL